MNTLLTPYARRLCCFERLLRVGAPVRSAALMERFGISLATFKRDLADLRMVHGAVIVYDGFENTCRLVNRDWAGVFSKIVEEVAA